MNKGKAKILIHNDGVHPEDPLIRQKVKQTKVMTKGESFGEIALFYNERRSATVIAVGECEAYIIDAKTFQQYIIMSRVQRFAAKANYLDGFNLFNALDNYQKLNLFEGFETVTYKKGQNIVTEGDKGDAFYVIERGICDVVKNIDVNGKSNFIYYRTLKSGNHFGEIALIKNIPRTATIRAQDEVKVIKLNANSFYFIQSTIEKRLKMDYGQNNANSTQIKPYS